MAASRNETPRVGPSRALMEAPPDTPVDEIPELLAEVPRFECQDCGAQRFGRSASCGDCGSEAIEKVPGPGVDA
jgi:uncharacterized OB-fold protein